MPANSQSSCMAPRCKTSLNNNGPFNSRNGARRSQSPNKLTKTPQDVAINSKSSVSKFFTNTFSPPAVQNDFLAVGLLVIFPNTRAASALAHCGPL